MTTNLGAVNLVADARRGRAVLVIESVAVTSILSLSYVGSAGKSVPDEDDDLPVQPIGFLSKVSCQILWPHSGIPPEPLVPEARRCRP